MQFIINETEMTPSWQECKEVVREGDPLSRYCKICRISAASNKMGYEYWPVRLAREYLEKEYLQLNAEGDIQTSLLVQFHAEESSVSAASRAIAGLCLRCDVSYFILKACQKISILFGGEKSFTYQDLLPFVLNDDGRDLIILDKDGRTQLILNNDGTTQIKPYTFFTVEILRTYKWNSHSKMSLANWAYLQTKQNQELKDFLSEFGFKQYSDWALLNKTRPKQLEKLSPHQRHLVEVFHSVYRRDRRKHQSKELKRCPDPDRAQIKEMLACLKERGIVFDARLELLEALKRVATHLRNYDIWSYREPIESYDPATEEYALAFELASEPLNELDLEEREFLEFLHQQLALALSVSIDREIKASITKLEKSKSYAIFARQYVLGLQMYYCQGMSLKDIAPELGMGNWDRAKRVLNPGQLLSKVRTLTIQRLLDVILKEASSKGLTKIPPDSDYLKNLAEKIEVFADEEVFKEAAAEIRTGKTRLMDSLYARQLRLYFQQPLKGEKE